MKSIGFKFSALLLFFVFATTISFAQDTDLKEKFQQKNNEMIEAMLNDNTDVLLNMYTEDAISLPSYEPMLRGKTAMIESHKRNKEAGMKMNAMTLKTMDVWSSGDFAYEIGTFTVDVSMPGMANMQDNGKYITIWEKQSDDTWKIKIDTWNSDNNPWANMQMTSEEDENME